MAIIRRSASSCSASRAEHRSLSITASMPLSLRFSSYMVGMPPPPAQITMLLFSSSHLIGRISKMRLGFGLATTRRYLSPSALTTQPFSLARRSASSLP
ncbi:hypothetical protein D3C75_953580 [compost metagenome]